MPLINHRCSDCRDTGWVTVWDGESLAALRDGELDVKRIRRYAVACHCRFGDRYVNAARGWRYQPSEMFIWDGADEAELAKAREFMENTRASKMRQYEWSP